MAVGMMWIPLFSSATNVLGLAMQIYPMVFITPKNISPIHFADNQNDFWGFIYMTNIGTQENNAESDEGWGNSGYNADDYKYEVGTWEADLYKCKDEVQWFYYDAQRGERLWPLNTWFKESFDQTDLEFSGGLYTQCVKAWLSAALEKCIYDSEEEQCRKNVIEEYSDDYGYYGMITHSYSGKDYKLVAWVNYQTGDWIKINSNQWLAPTFIRYANRYPLGFIYDTNGWVGFVWCYVKSWLNSLVENLMNNNWNLAELFTLGTDDKISIKVQTASFDCNPWSAMNSLIKVVVEGVVWMSTDTKKWLEDNAETKTQLFTTSSVNNATLINYTKQKAESLCRGKWGNCSNNSNNSCNDKIVCINNNTTTTIDASQYKWKTLIVKWWNVGVSPLTGYSDGSVYDIFVDGGNLILNEIGNWNIVIWENGFMTGSITGNYKGNNWEIGVASVLRWNFIVNGKIVGTGETEKKLSNRYFIYGKLTTQDSVTDLEKMFSWSCYTTANSWWVWSDGFACPESKYQGASLSVIDQNYPSPLQ